MRLGLPVGISRTLSHDPPDPSCMLDEADVRPMASCPGGRRGSPLSDLLLPCIAPDASCFFLNTPISAGEVLTSMLRPSDHVLRTVILRIYVSRNIVLAEQVQP